MDARTFNLVYVSIEADISCLWYRCTFYILANFNLFGTILAIRRSWRNGRYYEEGTLISFSNYYKSFVWFRKNSLTHDNTGVKFYTQIENMKYKYNIICEKCLPQLTPTHRKHVDEP